MASNVANTESRQWQFATSCGLSSGARFFSVMEGDDTVADCYGDEAEARLMAAAPDLLTALRLAEAFISIAVPQFAQDRDEAADEVLPAIRAAIARTVSGGA